MLVGPGISEHGGFGEHDFVQKDNLKAISLGLLEVRVCVSDFLGVFLEGVLSNRLGLSDRFFLDFVLAVDFPQDVW